MKTRISYAYELPLLYLGLFTFDIGELRSSYHFKKSQKNGRIDFHFLDLKTWKLPQKKELSSFEQWIYVFKESKAFTSCPKEIKDGILIKVLDLLDPSKWSDEDLKYYYKSENQWSERNNRVLLMYKDMQSLLIDKYLINPATKIKISIIPLFNQLVRKDIKIELEDFIYKEEIIEGRIIGRGDTMITALENIINTQVHKTMNNHKFKEVDFRIENPVLKEVIGDLIKKNEPATNN